MPARPCLQQAGLWHNVSTYNSPMKAIIFAAGIGSRLGKITKDRPKALVEIMGKTLLEVTIRKLIKYGFDEIIINVHHAADRIEKFLEDNGNFNIRIEVSDEREQLLETGGGLVKASWFFDDHKPFLTYNVDILTTLNLSDLLQHHQRTGALVTLACQERTTRRYFLTDEQDRLTGWENTETGERINVFRFNGEVKRVGYSGISVVNPGLFNLVTEQGVFSLTSLYLRLAAENPVLIYRHDADLWMDIGKPEQLKAAEEYFKERDVDTL
jgi:NDP-sugar pyrophosphorylase family protein